MGASNGKGGLHIATLSGWYRFDSDGRGTIAGTSEETLLAIDDLRVRVIANGRRALPPSHPARSN